MAGIYIHIPFCKQACYYCDFHFSTNQKGHVDMVAALAHEIELQRNYLSNEEIESIYFGGGTPSILDADEIGLLLQSIKNNYNAKAREVTLEANPDDLSPSKLRELRSVGINRLSIGIQSFDNSILKSLNRSHDAAASRQCINDAREAGFDNLSLDLIYAIPGQDDALWKANIYEALSYKPQHISAYSLTIEDKTVFGRRASQGKFRTLDDDHAALQLQMLVVILAQQGYEHYEVSNFSLAGFTALHNSNYWMDKKYLGIGPSAHSYNRISRQFNVSNNKLYVDGLKNHKIPATLETLSREDMINELLMTKLRTSWGVDMKQLLEQYGFDLMASHGDYISNLQQNKMAKVTGDQFVLTETGRLLADKIAADLFIVRSR
ncbi:MAG: radical SAM family heme chaperone HemW [Chryseolinea sp.]